MFSGLVQEEVSLLKVSDSQKCLTIELERPKSFKSLEEGESIAVDGVCLTLEQFNKNKMIFKVGFETLKITKWTSKKLKNKTFNLERSLTLQSALGGHLLTGHTDGLAQVMSIKKQGQSRIVQVKVPSSFKSFFWKKGYIALNGLSLTVNKVQGSLVEVCLIPKTISKTNISQIKTKDLLNFEVDYFTRTVLTILKNKSLLKKI